MSLQIVFNFVVVVFTVTNLVAMGLEINVRNAIHSIREPRVVVLILVWG